MRTDASYSKQSNEPFIKSKPPIFNLFPLQPKSETLSDNDSSLKNYLGYYRKQFEESENFEKGKVWKDSN